MTEPNDVADNLDVFVTVAVMPHDEPEAGFEPGHRADIRSGVRNGDFSEQPPFPAMPLDDATNKLPGFSLVQSSGSAFTVTWVAAEQALLFDMAPGATGDESYIEQTIQIGRQGHQGYAYVPGAFFEPTVDVSGFIDSEFLDVTGTVTGTPAARASTVDAAWLDSLVGTPPLDAVAIRIKVGAIRTGVAGATGSVTVRKVVAPDFYRTLYLPDLIDPTTYAPAAIRSADGTFAIVASGGAAYLTMDSTGAVTLSGGPMTLSGGPFRVSAPITMPEGAAPPTPDAGDVVLYPRSGLFYSMDDAGTETALGGGVGGGSTGPVVLRPLAWMGALNATTTTLWVTNVSYFIYVGRAMVSDPTVDVTCRVTNAAVTITWAEVGVFTGTTIPNAVPSLTRRGWADVSATFNSTGVKVTSITADGALAGDDLWVAFGSQATTPYQVRGGLGDDIVSGLYISAPGRISTLADPVASPALPAFNLAMPWLIAKTV